MQDREFNADGLQLLQTAMTEIVGSGDRPGIVTLVSQGRHVHVDAVGTHEFNGGPPMRRDTIFRIASTTKPIVAAIALSLVDQGKLRVDDPIDRWLPELTNRRVVKDLGGPIEDTVAARRPILVSDLLTMRMGAGWIMAPGDYPIQTAFMQADLLVPYRMPLLSPDEWLRRLSALPLMDHPGDVWRYDLSMTVLGALIMRLTDKPLGDAMAEHIFKPLDMADTGFSVPPEKLYRLPPCYRPNRQTGAMDVWDPAGPTSFWAKAPPFPGGHGGLVSTADDYLAFARMMMRFGKAADGRQVLSEQSVRTMMSDHVPSEVKTRSPFSPGFWDKRGWGYGGATVKKPVPGEPPRGFGWEGGYGVCAYWDDQAELFGIVLSQSLIDTPEYPPLYRQFWDAVQKMTGDGERGTS
jgi:CubicO group peptidase (beta-lactamase class C family)